MTDERASALSPGRARSSGQPNVTDVEGDIVFVDRAPAGFDHTIADAWADLAAHYHEIATEPFDEDPDLTSHTPPR